MHSAHSTFYFSVMIQKGKAADLPLRTCAKFILIKMAAFPYQSIYKDDAEQSPPREA